MRRLGQDNCLGTAHRRRSPETTIKRFSGDLRTPLARGHYEKYVGSNPATEWSPELDPVRASAAAYDGQTTIPSYGAWINSKTIWEGAYAHPEADANLADVGDGRRWLNHQRFWRASAEGTGRIRPIQDTSTRFLSYEDYWKHGGASELFLRARDGPHRRRPELGFQLPAEESEREGGGAVSRVSQWWEGFL
jgi:hypothetical protein